MSLAIDHRISRRTIRVLEDPLNYLYADAVLRESKRICQMFCDGCITHNLSQTKHECINQPLDEKVKMYFDCALRQLENDVVLESWENMTKNLDVPSEEYISYKSKIYCPLWRESIFKTDQLRLKIFQMAVRMAKFQERLKF